ncbi:MAG: ATP-binding cassette domain-containing protein [Cryobacterium sp.]|nr:ATP-binding cassette domain-containing protein [Cryobacterium sp.]
MANSTTIEVRNLSKSFGPVRAVDDLSFTVEPGEVTGFLGPNGAGKTTTLRTLLGLVEPSSGSATFGGVRYRQLKRPLETVGTALEASSFHPGRSGIAHLSLYATAAAIPKSRVEAVLTQVGMTQFANRRVGGYSLGMRQRLGLAFALLGDPGVLVLDEPVNGLDPEGISWMRTLLRSLAAEGRTVLISSHLLSEVQQSVDRVVIIAKGQMVYQGGLSGLVQRSRVEVESANQSGLAKALQSAGAEVEHGATSLSVSGLDAEQVGRIALDLGIALRKLNTEQTGLESAFLDLVGNGEQK